MAPGSLLLPAAALVLALLAAGCGCTAPTAAAAGSAQNMHLYLSPWANSTLDVLYAGPTQAGAQIGNGYVGAFVPISVPGSAGPPARGIEHVAGVFSGLPRAKGQPQLVTRVKLSAYTATAYIDAIDGVGFKKIATQSGLDMRHSAYLLSYATPGGMVQCHQRVYAHRARMHLVIAEFHCTNKGELPAFFGIVQEPHAAASPGVETDSVASNISGVACSRAVSAVNETAAAPRAVVSECHDVGAIGRPLTIPAKGSTTEYLISARCSNLDAGFHAAQHAADDSLHRAAEAYRHARANVTDLFLEHSDAMASLHRPGISIGGNPGLARAVNASMLALLNSVRSGVNYSSSPEGLIGGRYGGHVFWDAETWQLPTWNIFYPSIARAVLQYRVDRAREAERNARKDYDLYGKTFTFEGAKFPWESAWAGVEQDPGNTEDHLQGDIAFALLQHWWATGDREWLQASGYPVLEGLATFYASRVRCHASRGGGGGGAAAGTCSIERTMGPDEYHGNVTDSVYGNTVAKLTLQAAVQLAPLVGKAPNATFRDVAERLRILFHYDKGGGYHPEFDGWVPGPLNSSAKIKQADVALLGYPLSVHSASSTRRNDLAVYSKVTDPAGYVTHDDGP